MRVLAVTKIFPNVLEPLSAPFNRQQFAALGEFANVEVLATIPWFPGASLFRRWSSTGRLSGVPAREHIAGLPVKHPRYAYLPKFGHSVAGPLYAASLAANLLAYRGRVDVLLGSWAYPDGWATVLLAEMLGVPAVVKVHGSDLNVLPKLPGLRERIGWALTRAERVVAVSRALADTAVSLGVPADRIDLVPNGIDRERFRPRDRAEARAALGITHDGPVVLYVGHVTEAKGAFDLVRAFGTEPALRAARLVIVGDGAGFEACQKLATELRVEAFFAGAEPHERIPTWLAACDLLALPSWNEGTPNVVLEALASGRRVVATNVGGIPDVVASPELGTLVPPRDVPALARALGTAISVPYDPATLAAASPSPSWRDSARLLHGSLLSALEARANRSVTGIQARTQAA